MMVNICKIFFNIFYKDSGSDDHVEGLDCMDDHKQNIEFLVAFNLTVTDLARTKLASGKMRIRVKVC